MPGLPAGWESDYDGKRWFYKYKANGHVQYHFPSEGDEFPDYVDALSPAPALAPEERLESQQQVKRLGSTNAGRTIAASDGVPFSKVLPWQRTVQNGIAGAREGPGRMSATARPVSFVWVGEAGEQMSLGEEDAVFQPESLMFLGPGTYNDVSPLADEEEEAARRVIVGDGHGKGVSPDISTGTTPQVMNSELQSPSESPLPTAGPALVVASGLEMGPILNTPTEEEEEEEVNEPVIHMIDSREIPVELPGSEPWQDPVGRIAEMATSETPTARIETHPEPVEIGEGREIEIGQGREITALKPSEPARVVDIFVGSSQKTSTDSKSKGVAPEQLDITSQPVMEEAATHLLKGEEARGNVTEPLPVVALGSEEFKSQTPEVSAPEPRYQPYKPGLPVPEVLPRKSAEMIFNPGSLQRERSLLMGPAASGGQTVKPASIPNSLSISNPKLSAECESHAKEPTSASLPEPAKISNSMQETASQEVVNKVAKFPSILRPARGGALSQPRARANSVEEQHEPVAEPRDEHMGHQPDHLGGRLAAARIPDPQCPGGQAESRYPPGLGPPSQSLPSTQKLHLRTTEALSSNTMAMHRATSVTTRKAVPTRPNQSAEKRASPDLAATAMQQPWERERRHSSFSPSDVSSLTSRHGSVTLENPLDSPSPTESLGREPSFVSLSQVASFTPSPPSLTPGSARQSTVSPLSAPTVRPGLPNSSSDVSYFGKGPVTAIHEQSQSASSGLSRSQSTHQPSSLSQLPGMSKPEDSIASGPGHHLSSIREHDETTSGHESRALNSQSLGKSRRNSEPSSGPTMPLQTQDDGLAVQNLQHQRLPDGPQRPAPASRQLDHHIGSRPVPRHGHHPIPIHPSGPHPKSPMPQLPTHGAPMPSQGHPQNHTHPRRIPGMSQAAPPMSIPPKLVSVSTAPTKPKEKDKKWTKWFKSSKSPAPIAQSAQTEQAANRPAAQSQTQQVPWPANHPIPQGPPPGTPGPPMPWSPNQIRPHLHRSHSHLAPQRNSGRFIPPPTTRSHVGHQTPRPESHERAGPMPVGYQQYGPHPHRQSMPPLTSAQENIRWPQRASGDSSTSAGTDTQLQWR